MEENPLNLTKSLKKYGFLLSLLLLLVFVIFVINQVYQIYTIAFGINPLFGKSILIVLASLFTGGLLLPIIMFLKIPKGLKLPKEGDEEALQLYLIQLGKRLGKNNHLLKHGFKFKEGNPKEEVEAALGVLDQESDKIIKRYSSSIFLTTAISQNGSLDGLFVFINLSKMIWDIAHLYNQRPSARELIKLYLNVGGTVLAAKEINELNLLEEQLEPIIGAFLGESIIASQTLMVSNLIANSVIEGSANAFLALRVGKITMKYCNSLTQVDSKKVRRTATLEACSLLGAIVRENTKIVVNSAIKGAGRATVGLFKRGKDKLFGIKGN